MDFSLDNSSPYQNSIFKIQRGSGYGLVILKLSYNSLFKGKKIIKKISQDTKIYFNLKVQKRMQCT